MPYNIRKQKCKQSDGDRGTYVLSYTDKKGKKHRACHTSKKKAQGQIAAIEGPREADEAMVDAMPAMPAEQQAKQTMRSIFCVSWKNLTLMTQWTSAQLLCWHC